jgi:hypothetical protein
MAAWEARTLAELKDLSVYGPWIAFACGKLPVEISPWKFSLHPTTGILFSSIRDNAGLFRRNQFVGNSAPTYLPR